jgi:hypothetical protein
VVLAVWACNRSSVYVRVLVFHLVCLVCDRGVGRVDQTNDSDIKAVCNEISSKKVNALSSSSSLRMLRAGLCSGHDRPADPERGHRRAGPPPRRRQQRHQVRSAQHPTTPGTDRARGSSPSGAMTIHR